MARVLLVDDDIAEISAAKRVLARAGHQPVLATNAQDALASIAHSPPDLLLVGSTCEGGEALRRFADDPTARALPLVVLGESAAAPPGSAQVPRPVDPSQLAQQVSASLAAGPTPPAPAVPRIAPPQGMPAPRRVIAAGKVGPGAAKAGAPTNGAPPADPAAARRAAAEALRARAEELRRASPAPAQGPKPTAPAHAALDLEDGGLEAILRRAEEAERAHAAEKKARARQADRARVEAAQRAEAERLAIEKAARAREAEQRARAEEAARREAEERSRRETEERERTDEETRARAAEEELRRAAEAEERERAEEQARLRLESELDELRGQVEAERRTGEEKTRAVLARAEAEERAAEDLRRLAEDEARQRAEEEARRRDDEEEKLRKAIEGARMEMESLRKRSEDEARERDAEEEELRKAIASARAEMESLRRKSEDEARRRAEAEAELARLAREAERRVAEAAAQPAPFDFPEYRPMHEDPAPDPAEEAARRRVASLRERPRAPRSVEPPEPIGAEPAPSEPEPPRPVPPAPPELRSGNLGELPAPRLLALAARSELSGRIDFESETARSIWFEEGRVVGAASADPSERVEELALRLGLVTRDQHRQITTHSAALGSRRAAVLLVERGFIKPNELTPLVRRRTEEVLFGVFAEPEARFRWTPVEVPPDERTALDRGTLALAVEGVRRRWLGPQVDAVLGGPSTLLSPVATGPSPADLGLSQPERRAVAFADGLRTLDEIVGASPLDPLSTRQVLAALVLVGALAVRVFQGGRPAAAATAAIDLARVREKLDQVRRADYFAILGVGRLCTPHEVREAARRLEAEFDPRRYEGVREEGLEGRLREILGVLADAKEILVDDRLRDEYLRGLGD